MLCGRVEELLFEYIDEIMENKIKIELEAHLNECLACQKKLQSLRATMKQLHSVAPVKPPDDFLAQVHSRIERRFEFENLMKKAFFPRRKGLPLEAVGVLVSVLFVVITYKYIQNDFSLYAPSLDDTSKQAVFVSESKKEKLNVEASLKNKAVSADIDYSNMPRPSSAANSFSAKPAYDSAVSLTPPAKIGSGAQEAGRGKGSIGETMRPVEYSAISSQRMPGEIMPKADKIIKEKVNFDKPAAAKESEQLYATDTSLNVSAEVAGSSKMALSKAEISNKSFLSEFSLPKSTPESEDLVIFQIDSKYLAINNIYQKILEFLATRGGNVVRSEFDKDGIMSKLIVNIPLKNLPGLKDYLRTFEAVSERPPEEAASISPH